MTGSGISLAQLTPYALSGVLAAPGRIGTGRWPFTTYLDWDVPAAGLLFLVFTYYAGFKVNSDEYNRVGLAPYRESRHI